MADCPPHYPTNPAEATTSLELFPILPADCPATPGGPSAVQVLNPPETKTSLDNFLDSTADCPRPSGGPSAVRPCEPPETTSSLEQIRASTADRPLPYSGLSAINLAKNNQRQHRLWTKTNLTGGPSAPPRRTVRDN